MGDYFLDLDLWLDEIDVYNASELENYGGSTELWLYSYDETVSEPLKGFIATVCLVIMDVLLGFLYSYKLWKVLMRFIIYFVYSLFKI